jgi:membrane protein YdbS with pleckstrin-like domain
MPLIACPDCGKQVSTAAVACPACGCPVPKDVAVVEAKIGGRAPIPVAAELLLKVRPSWWNFSWHWVVLVVAVSVLLFLVPRDYWNVGWIVIAVWLLFSTLHSLYHRKSFVMRIYPDRVTVVEGFLSLETSEFFIRDIRSIDVRQSIWGRIVNIGDLTISTSATSEASEVAAGIPGPNRIKDLLISRRRESSAD